MATPAQDEYNTLMQRNAQQTNHRRHPSDTNSDSQSFLNLSDDDDDDGNTTTTIRDSSPALPRPSYSTSRSTATIPTTRYEANTGPKGVIADAQNFRDARREDRRVSLQQAHRNGNGNGNGGFASRDVGDRLGDMTFGEREVVGKRLDGLGLGREGEGEVDELEELGEGDEAFLREWRGKRLREMQSVMDLGNGGSSNGRFLGGSRSTGGRRFGQLASVDGEGYLEAVDGSGPGTVVVVYIYDDMSDVSLAIESCFRTLASKHPSTKFIKLHYQDAEMEPAGVPALIAYQDGEKFADIVPIVDALPDDADLSALTLEAILRR
ncbi:hypothetical protein MBLNU230_g4527t1 [Neophaeotheca triangularis]